MIDSKSSELSRRRLFAAAGSTAALATAAVVLPLVPQADAVDAAAKPAPDAGGGYQLTQHVLRYYQTARV